MRVHIKQLSTLTDNSYLRADFKFTYYHDTVFVELKKQWKDSVKLRQIISKIRSGKGFAKREYAEYETDICYLRVNNLGILGELNLDDVTYLKEEEMEQLSDLALKEGEYLISRSGTIGIVFKFEKEKLPEKWKEKMFVPSEDLIIFRVYDSMDSEHLKYFLYSSVSREYFESVSFGKSQGHISHRYIGNWLVPLKSLKNIPVQKIKEKEQEIIRLKSQLKDSHSIVNKVFGKYLKIDLEEYSRLQKRNVFKVNFSEVTKSKQLRISTKFHHPQYTYIMELLKDYKTVKLKQLLKEPVRRGVQPEYDSEGDIIVIKTASLRNKYIDLSNAEYTNKEFFISKKRRAGVKYLDILMASTGTGSIGKVDIWEYETEALADGHISIIRVNPNKVNPYYLTYYLRSVFGTSQVYANFSGMSNQIEIYPVEIENFLVILPEKHIQKQIVTEIQKQLEEQKKMSERIDSLKHEIDEMIKEAILGPKGQ